MLTTTQVRAIIRKFPSNAREIYTNKTTKGTTNLRSVKCYFLDNYALLKELQTAAGHNNVSVTIGSDGYRSGGEGIVVKCILA
jgi:hypothetical protein